MTVRIRAFRDGYRRAGVAHTTEFKEYSDGFFSKEQIQQLEDDPNIVVEYTHAPPGMAKEILDGVRQLHGLETSGQVEKEHPGTGEEMTPVPGQVLEEPGPPIEEDDGELATAVAEDGIDPLPTTALPDLPEPDPDEVVKVRAALGELTVPKLKKECDGMDIEYPKNAKKDDLIELIIKNTAVAPVDDPEKPVEPAEAKE